MHELKPGKLPPDLLADLLQQHTSANDRLVVPPRLGEDAAVIAFPDRYLVLTTDPITFATEDLGHYVVTVNANDIAALGAIPLFFSCTLLLPVGTQQAQVERTFAEIAKACAELELTWTGGHTEITPTVRQIVAVGQMMGEAPRDRLVRKSDLRPGDRLLLTKALAVEGVSLIARARAAEVQQAQGREFHRRALRFLWDPGISVVSEAIRAASTGGVHAMHDLTEGGLSGGLHELTAGAELGARLRRDAIPISDETRALCQQFGLDALGLIASGCLLLAVVPERVSLVRKAVQDLGVSCAEIGEITASPGCRFEDDTPLPSFAVDEITKLFAGAP